MENLLSVITGHSYQLSTLVWSTVSLLSYADQMRFSLAWIVYLILLHTVWLYVQNAEVEVLVVNMCILNKRIMKFKTNALANTLAKQLKQFIYVHRW